MKTKNLIQLIGLAVAAVFLAFNSVTGETDTEKTREQMDTALELLHSGRYKEAYQLLLDLHENGKAIASENLGYMYLNGDWVERDISKGRSYLKHASENNNAEATFWLGNTYRGVDTVLYAEYQEKAAQQGHLIAAQQIGRAYYYGNGVPQDDVSAFKWLYSIQLRTPVAVETWTEPLAALNERMDEKAIEEAMLMAWNHIYLELKDGFFQEVFDEDNAGMEGPIKKGEYIIREGRLIMTGNSRQEEAEVN